MVLGELHPTMDEPLYIPFNHLRQGGETQESIFHYFKSIDFEEIKNDFDQYSPSSVQVKTVRDFDAVLYGFAGLLAKLATTPGFSKLDFVTEPVLIEPVPAYYELSKNTTYFEASSIPAKLKVTKYEHLSHLPKEEHTLALLVEWWYKLKSPTSVGKLIHIPGGTVEELFKLNRYMLLALCKLFVPHQYLKKMSQTRAAMLSFLSGNSFIIPPWLDPTRDDLSDSWRIITKNKSWSLFKLSLRIDDIYGFIKINSSELTPISYGSFYMRFNDNRYAHIIAMLNVLERKKDQIQTVYDSYAYDNFSTVSEDREVVQYMNDLGTIPALFISSNTFALSLVLRLNIDFMTNVEYLMTKHGLFDRTPLLLTMERNQILHNVINLNRYSMRELVNFYLPFYREDLKLAVMHFTIGDVDALRTMIFATYENDGRGWVSINFSHCSNDSSYDVMSGMSKLEIRAVDREKTKLNPGSRDPTLSYTPSIFGARRRCFKVSELIDSFRETENGFEFLDPDYVAPGMGREVAIDPTTGKPLERTFPIMMIKQLYSYLRSKITHAVLGLTQIGQRTGYFLDRLEVDEITKSKLKSLYEHMKLGIKDSVTAFDYLNAQRKFVSEHSKWRNDLLIYFGWIFLFAMWIRFWKGPGAPYPTEWKEMADGGCTHTERNQHINIELSVHGNIILKIENDDPELSKYINELPFLHFDWSSGLITRPNPEVARRLMGIVTLEELIDKVQFGDFCMAQGTDLLTGSAFIYLTEVMSVPRDRISDLLLHVMKLLYQYELFSISSREQTVLSSGVRDEVALETISNHRRILDAIRQDFVQPPIDLSSITETQHLVQGFADIMGDELE